MIDIEHLRRTHWQNPFRFAADTAFLMLRRATVRCVDVVIMLSSEKSLLSQVSSSPSSQRVQL
jgi:hypothetical protein